VVTISMFDSEEAALESIERSRMWVQENVAQYLSEPPEIVTGVSLIDIARP
jgi:cytochrome c2